MKHLLIRVLQVHPTIRKGLLAAATMLPAAAVFAATQYVYDELGRLALVVKDGGPSIVYAHDENGNVVSITRSNVRITSFSPTSAYVGDPITIVGKGFDPDTIDNTVVIGGAAATVTSASTTSLVAPIPAGATTGPISVTVAGDTAVSAQSLTVLVPTPPSSMAWLMGFEGSDGGTPNDDESSHNRTVTVGGGAQIDTGVVLVGSSSLLLDGTGDYLSVADNPVFEADGAFVAEVTLRRNDTGRNQVVFGKRNGGSQHGWTFNINASNQLQAVAWSNGGGTPVVNINSTSTLTTGVTYKVAVERTAGGVWTIYLNGAIAAQGTETATPTGNGEALYLGRDSTNTSRDFAGWMDEARFCREALYNATAYTPATLAFPR